MSKSYQHLTEEERIEIYAMKQEGKTVYQMASFLERAPSTIYREINRNSGQRGYRPKQAHHKASERQYAKSKTAKMTDATKRYINKKLALQWSPEQIANTMPTLVEKDIYQVSHECIYLYIWDDKRCGGHLYQHLRIGHKDKYRKRYGKQDYRGKIPERKDIEERPAIVDSKTRAGDWEADLVSGIRTNGYLVTLVERFSKTTLIGYVSQKTSDEVTAEIIKLLKPYASDVHTITFDNGREFSGHILISQQLSCECYFAKPYHSWERGLNENTNGLIRQYFPKKHAFPRLVRRRVKEVMELLNTRPRKSLDYETPKQVYSRAIRKAA